MRHLLKPLHDGAQARKALCWLAAIAAGWLLAAPVAAQAPPPFTFTNLSWSEVAQPPFGTNESQGRVVNGKLYQFGGFDVQKQPAWTPTKRAFVFDPVANSWAPIADLPHLPNGPTFGGVTNAGVATDGTDLYLAGGYTSNAAGTGQIFGTQQVWKYLVATNSYVRLPDLPTALAAGALEFVDGRLYYIGGQNWSRVDQSAVYVLNLAQLNAGWQPTTPLPAARNRGASAVWNKKIYWFGGQTGVNSTLQTQRTTFIFDTTTATWSTGADMPVPAGTTGRGHLNSGAAMLGDLVVVFGGETSHNVMTSIVSVYAPEADLWRGTSWMPVQRHSGVAGMIGNRFYYAGGLFSARTYRAIPDLRLLTFTPSTLSATATPDGPPQTLSSTLTASPNTFGITMTASPPVSWLTLPSATPGTVNFGVDVTGLQPGPYATRVTASIPGYLSATLDVTLTVGAGSAPPPVRLNTGGGVYVTGDGRRFEADAYFGGTLRTSLFAGAEIENTTDDPLYRDARSSTGFTYSIPFPDGPVQVVLHFCETWFGVPGRGGGGAGSRQFNVDVQGQRRLTNYDVFVQAGGALRPRTEVLNAQVTGGVLQLAFSRGAADIPQLSAIEVIAVR